ncbi:MAG: tyrosine-type recombinase/integrase [Pirellulaceae bacterium]|nr:tyrosine-type recombinase/integrase [Pirellulaceae bacterium]
MASIAKDKNGTRRILFVAPDGRRPTIRLGKVSQRAAESIKYRVEQLLESLNLNRPMEADLAQWVTNLEPWLAKRLAAVGLIPNPEAKAAATLGPFLTDFVERRIDVKPATKEVWSQVIRNLVDHFGADRDLAEVTEADAEDFKMYLVSQKLAPTTVAKRLQFARMFFKAAKKRKLIADNPFAEVSAKAVMRQDRQRFITPEETDRLLAVCNPTWRVIVALSRYGGLRCPSEVLSLRWQDVDWEAGRIVVQSPKTEHHVGKASRTIPLFAELRPILSEAFDLAPDGAVYVVDGNHREAANTASGWRNCNLRTQFERIVKRAGLQPWPRLFHAMRATRETELAKEHPIHVVTAWLGNTPRIALKHYLQVTDADFERAAQATKQGGAQSGARSAQNAAQPGRAAKGGESHDEGATPLECAAFATPDDTQLSAAKELSGEDRIRTCGGR